MWLAVAALMIASYLIGVGDGKLLEKDRNRRGTRER